MTFDNSTKIISLRIRLFAETVVLLGFIAITYFAKLLRFPILGMSDTLLTVILIFIYFVLIFYPMALNYQYIYFSDDGDSIIFRYFMAGIVGGKKNSVEISKESYAGYKKESRFFGLIQNVILYQQLREGVAKYPPIYISILTRKEKAKVLNSLYLHTPKDVKDAGK